MFSLRHDWKSCPSPFSWILKERFIVLAVDSSCDALLRAMGLHEIAAKKRSRALVNARLKQSVEKLCYWIELAACEKTPLALEPIIRTVPTTSTRITASITAYSAMS